MDPQDLTVSPNKQLLYTGNHLPSITIGGIALYDIINSNCILAAFGIGYNYYGYFLQSPDLLCSL